MLIQSVLNSLRWQTVSVEKKVATFLTVMGAKTKAHFSKHLLIAGRIRFYKHNQEEEETVTMFVAELRKLAEHCGFKEDSLNEVIRDIWCVAFAMRLPRENC